jgi:GAF domain-containing protein
MQAAPLPADEAQRLQALRELLILDTPPEERFDRIVRFAAEELDVPIALLNLVDAERQWTKAAHGLEPGQAPREESFCAHAILGSEPLEVEDARQDPRFHDNPMVLGEPRVVFYAGEPLRLQGGAAVGTLCLVDHAPRRLDRIDRTLLRILGRLLAEELERRQREGDPA